jgi:hypothetical protein
MRLRSKASYLIWTGVKPRLDDDGNLIVVTVAEPVEGHRSIQFRCIIFRKEARRALMKYVIAAASIAFSVTLSDGAWAQTLTECGKSDGYAYFFAGGFVPADKGGWKNDSTGMNDDAIAHRGDAAIGIPEDPSLLVAISTLGI